MGFSFLNMGDPFWEHSSNANTGPGKRGGEDEKKFYFPIFCAIISKAVGFWRKTRLQRVKIGDNS